MKEHIHISVLSLFKQLLELLLILIPIKIIAARYSNSSALADAVLNVL
jgi:hypothetical protein